MYQLAGWGGEYECPIICAGDIFDKWDAPAELVNHAITWLPHMFVVPGQHDLPNHSDNEFHRSALCTLELAERVTVVENWVDAEPGLLIYGAGWNQEIKELPVVKSRRTINILAAHRYVWRGAAKHTKACDEDNFNHLCKTCDGYDAVVFGDNHMQWSGRVRDTIYWNNGSMMRRTRDQRNHQPHAGLLSWDSVKGNKGKMEIRPLQFDIGKDQIAEHVEEAPEGEPLDFKEFLEDLGQSMASSGDLFETGIKEFIRRNKLDDKVKGIITRLMKDS